MTCFAVFVDALYDIKYKLDGTIHRIDVTEDEDGVLSYTIDGSTEPLVIKNHLKGTLVVNKTVDSVIESDSTKNFSFTAALSDTTINGKYGDLTFANGVATFTLKHGEEKKIRNLVGKQIAIKENDAAAYTTTASAETGTYNAASKAYTIIISEDGDSINFHNELKGVPVRIVKETQFGEALEGAVFSFSGDGIEDQTGVASTIPEEGTEAVIIEEMIVPLGTYTLTETSTPAGYNSLDGPVVITVATDEETGDVTVSATINGKQDGSHVKIDRDTNAEGKPFKITIVNDAGVELPHTGGIGTTVFYILGALLVLGCGATLIARRRCKA